MPGYKLTIKNAKVVLKTIADYIINLVGIKDNNTGTGNVTSGFIDWKIQHYSDTAANFTSLNPVLLVGQLGIETDALATSPKFKIGDGLTAWNSLPYVGGSSLGYTPEDVANKSTNVNTDKASSTKYPSVKAIYDWATGLFVKKGTLTNNYIPKATSSDTIGDSQITDDGTTVTVNNKLSILKNTVGTGQKGVSVNFNTIGEVFYIDDNGYLVYNANAGATFKGSNGIIDIVSNGGTEPILSFKYNNGSNTSGLIKGIGGKLIIDTPLLELSQLTPSQIVATDASKNLQSLDVATYPSLTELSYVKGVTSALQTQLDGKANNLLAKQNTTITHTGTTAETKIYSALIPAGSVQANDVLKLLMKAFGVSGVASKSFRMYFNTSDAIGGVQVGINTIAATVSNVTTRNIFCRNSLSSQLVIIPTTSVANEEYTNQNAGSYSTVSIDFSLPQYFIVSCQLTTGTESASILGLTLQAER